MKLYMFLIILLFSSNVIANNSVVRIEAPKIIFTDITGEKFKLEDFKGSIILVNFFASWCAPCKDEFPSMVELLKNYNGKVKLVAISIDKNISDINKFISGVSKNNLYVVWDKNQTISKDIFGSSKLPETIIIDRDGMMVNKIIGGINWLDKDIINYLDNL